MDTAAQVDTLARKMNNEDLTSVIQFMNFLIEQRRSKAARDNQQTLMSIQDMFKDDKGWNSEDEIYYMHMNSTKVISQLMVENLL